MMRSIRRHDLSPRVEMLPLIDVVFLLLTFFIYSMIVMVRAEVLPVTLTTLSTGGPAQPGRVQAITIDGEGGLYLNREPIDDTELSRRLQEMANGPDQPKLYLALEAQGTTDRGPLLIELIEQVRSAGIEDFAIVGQPVTPDPQNTE